MGISQSKTKKSRRDHKYPRLLPWEARFGNIGIPILNDLAICLPCTLFPRFECSSNEKRFHAKAFQTCHVICIYFADSEELKEANRGQQTDSDVLNNFFPCDLVPIIEDFIVERIRIYGNMNEKELEELLLILSGSVDVKSEIENLERQFPVLNQCATVLHQRGMKKLKTSDVIVVCQDSHLNTFHITMRATDTCFCFDEQDVWGRCCYQNRREHPDEYPDDVVMPAIFSQAVTYLTRALGLTER